MDTEKKPVSAFRGLDNVNDPLRLSLDSLVQADNVDLTNDASLIRCSGFTRRTTNVAITGAYATKDMKRLYLVDSGELRQMNADLTYTTLRTGLSANKTWFEEVNGSVYYANGVDYGIVGPGGWRTWGIAAPALAPNLALTGGGLPQGIYQVCCTYTDATGLESGGSDIAAIRGSGQINISNVPQQAGYSTNVYVTFHDGTVFYLLQAGAGPTATYNSEDNLGTELPFWGTDIPRGTMLTYFKGQLYIAEAYRSIDATAIWATRPLHFHHFDYSGEGLMVPGTVLMLKGTEDALFIGTERAIFAWDGEKLIELAEYGVVTGTHAVEFQGKLYFWSLRGLCCAPPFTNMSEATLSVAPGASAGATVIEKDGMRRYVVALKKDGQPYNRR
jgi:hypothetical protein